MKLFPATYNLFQCYCPVLFNPAVIYPVFKCLVKLLAGHTESMLHNIACNLVTCCMIK